MNGIIKLTMIGIEPIAQACKRRMADSGAGHGEEMVLGFEPKYFSRYS